MLARLIKLEEPRIAAHVWFPAWEQFKRSRITIDQLGAAFEDLSGAGNLVDREDTISSIFTGVDKIGIAVSHVYANDDVVCFTTTDTLFAPVVDDGVYYVVNSNPTEGSIQISTTPGGAVLDLTSVGVGTHTIKRVDADVGFWDRTRQGVTSATGLSEQALLRIIWDLKAEGLAITSAEGVLATTEADFKTELETLATWVDEAL